MKDIFSKKRKIPRFIACIALGCICIGVFCACSQSSPEGALLSPALNTISQQNNMAKSALKGENISFSAEDFARNANLSSIDEITITSLPPKTDGELRVGALVLNEGQTLSAASIELLTFVPKTDTKTSEFRFCIDDTSYEMCCKLYLLDDYNYAPTLSTVSKNALEVSTYKNVTLYGNLPCYDPEGDTTYIEIVSYPKKGVLILEDSTVGNYRFIPYENSTGKDSFTYVAKDMYGNYSASATVSLQINRKETPVSYVDLADSPYHNAAIAMTENQIMSGTQVGSNVYFYPDREVSRAEFLVMAMNSAGITDVNPITSTVFADDSDIPSQMKSYVAVAYELGYIKGTQIEEKLYFEPNRAITRAEAAVMLSNMLDAAIPTVKLEFSDSDDIPSWAEASIQTMNYMGILPVGNGNEISPTASVTRGDAAEILKNFMNTKTSR